MAEIFEGCDPMGLRGKSTTPQDLFGVKMKTAPKIYLNPFSAYTTPFTYFLRKCLYVNSRFK